MNSPATHRRLILLHVPKEIAESGLRSSPYQPAAKVLRAPAPRICPWIEADFGESVQSSLRGQDKRAEKRTVLC